jgi:hypothetical protein
MARDEAVATTFGDPVRRDVSASPAAVDDELARCYPGDPGIRRPVHTVYVPADALTGETVRAWGDGALALLDAHAPDAASLAAVRDAEDGGEGGRVGAVCERVRAKPEREPVEDLRIDFEDGYGIRPDGEEDADAVRAARLVAACADGTAPPYTGVRMKSLEAAVRDRGIRAPDVFLTVLTEAGGLPGGLVVTLPEVTHAEQVGAMARLCGEFRAGARAAAGPDRLRGPGRDHPGGPRPRRPRHRRPHDRRGRGARDGPALRRLRPQRRLRGGGGVPVPGPPGGRPTPRR